jgi:hypothetical protein
MHRSDEAMICTGIFKKDSNIFVISAEKLCRLRFYIVSRSPALFNDDFCMNLYSVDSDEAMKRGDEAFNGSSLQFLRSVKRFMASIFYLALNASSPLILKKNRRLTLYRRYFFKQIHCLTLLRH